MRIEDMKAYEIIQKKDLGDIHAEGTLLRHKKSGARIALVSCDDENKVFSIAFRTPPENSTGVAHILEHSVLCGSKNFPLKDPFIELVKGSLNTFLNAMTYPDKTVYPVASCNDQDFHNLMHVYLDAVFYPNVYKEEKIFRQEGWSYELNAPEEELSYNGVVYNEMKGAFSSPDGVLDREIVNSLYPDTCYGVESGGDPRHIPELTYEEFLNFHSRYYHPSNSYIYLYGDMDMVKQLEFLDQAYLSDFEAISLDSEVALQDPFEEPIKKSLFYPISDAEPLTENTYLSWQKVIGETLDIRTMLSFDILDYCLMSSPGAPLEKALFDAGIGKDVYANFESDLRQPFFSVVAKNANEEQLDQFVSIIEETLKEQVKNGISEKAILAGINYEEFRFREADYGRSPKGLLYGISMLSTWLYEDQSAFSCLELLDEYAFLRSQTKTGYFENLIQKYLLDNTHGSTLTLVPKRGLTEEREKKIQSELASYKASLSEEELNDLVEKTNELRAYQKKVDSPEDVAKIPLLSRSDLKRDVRPIRIVKDEKLQETLLFSEEETNGIAYLQFYFSMKDIPEEMAPFLSLLQGVLGMVDTKSFSYDEIAHEVNLHTGGIEADLSVVPDYADTHMTRYEKYFRFRGKALYDELSSLFHMIEEIILTSKVEDEKRLLEILSQGTSRLSMKFLTAGHQTAILRGLSYDGGVSLFREYTEGISFYRVIKDLEAHFEERKEQVIVILRSLMKILFTKDRLFLHVTGAAAQIDSYRAELEKFMEILPTSVNGTTIIEEIHDLANEVLMESKTNILPSGNEGFMSASEVQYVARCGTYDTNVVSYTGAMAILRTILNYDYLWKNIREQGGAYGCMSSMTRDGKGYFVSYRDPHLGKTNEVYDGIPGYLEGFRADEREMTKYIIGTLSSVDAPLSPEQRGARSLLLTLSHLNPEQLQEERNQILDATDEDIRALSEPVKAILQANNVCVIGGEAKIRESEGLFNKVEPLI